uniref:hypothetical protein n=1 Tax=Verminephrobacter eiseniae TaxID=364317 RepID=UPI0022384705|nr:hypothetical protein [Verminephrobacter eiseniae]
MNLDQFAPRCILSVPRQFTHGLVGSFAATVVHLAVALERTVEDLTRTVQVQHDVLGGVPRIYQHRPERQLLDGQCIVEHLPHVGELGLAVDVRCVDAPVDDPIALGSRVHVQAIDDTDALDQVVRVTSVLQAYQINLVRMVLVQNGVVKHDVAIGIGFNLILGLLPGNRRR